MAAPPQASVCWARLGRNHGAISRCSLGAFRPLGLSDRAGIDLVVGDLPRVVYGNPLLTTSIVGIARVMRGGAGGPYPEGAGLDAAGEGEGGGRMRVSEG
ncbi:hypothetical protein P0O24_02255 [Methanotrichaceae archaeon M04Ac]|jgi:hypothetical protein|uniref:Uncharacterized protein n=1 Tax=Candidatus Methanocrinis alkalitolerans TaxID=3033395 RepID=A0ABT5XCF9_9EURY|nr:hypothetical protein [Candidatus Methanocrinis alkalitolerans]MCR3883137.1 hypothetical protein [Methanothrix sp.]MDF0592403.1 hypothetical protein [Candidatus Methanocrinis alkalitolerans]